MGSIAATFLFYLDPEVRRDLCIHRTPHLSPMQSSYLSLVRVHDVYNMHSIFSPGFPGLLENIYVQERLIETLMPEVYKSFVRYLPNYTVCQLLKLPSAAKEYGFNYFLRDKMVHYTIC